VQSGDDTFPVTEVGTSLWSREVIAQFTLLSSELPIKVETDSLRSMLVALLVNVPNVRLSGCEKVLFSEV
jgi:hypothetical protein